MGFFNQQEIETARNYKYSGQDDSICVKLFLRKYWDTCIKFVPMWIAPNLITLIGFMFEILSFVVSFVLSFKMKYTLPSWVPILNAICLHLYSTLDNLDGRQARRTNSSSALGQFFDHGCDAFTTVLEMMKAEMTFDYEPSIKSFLILFIISFGFYTTTWEEYNTNHFYLGFINGPDDCLLALQITYILIGIFPSLTKYLNPNFLLTFVIIGCVYTVALTIHNIYCHYKENPRVAKKFILSFIPCLISILLFSVIVYNFPEFTREPYFIAAASLILQFGSQNLVVCHISGRPPKSLFTGSTIFLWFMAIVTVILDKAYHVKLVWGMYFFVVVGIMLIFDVRVVKALSYGLNIPIFTLPNRSFDKKGNSDIKEDEKPIIDGHSDEDENN